MCGIAGFLHGKHRPEPGFLSETAAAMASAIRHRGPDAQGVWFDPKAGVAFGHCRLSIIDLSEAGAQPIVSSSGRYILTYNGEIYNFRTLRRELEDRGQRFKGHSDTEVLLAGIDNWGVEETLQRVNGMFAFALWDRRDEKLILARDRIGKKPLYYGWADDTFLFASELRVLRHHPDFPGDIDQAALSQLLRCGWIAQPRSIFKGIFKMPPGSMLELDPGDPEKSAKPLCYWSAKELVEAGEREPFESGYAEATQDLDMLLREAVSKRMVADVDLGALLSGGIDSSIVVAIMQSLSDRPIKTFSVGFDEAKYNEAPHAKRIANHLKTDHHEVYLTSAEALDVARNLPRIFDEPFADPSQIPTYLISKVAREQVKVVLSGDGGDELFAGYGRYQEILTLWRRWGWIPTAPRAALGETMAAFSRAAWQLSDGHRPNADTALTGWRRWGSKWERDGLRFAADCPRNLLARLLSTTGQSDALLVGGQPAPSVLDLRCQWADVQDPLQGMMHLDFIGYLPDDILVKVDRASMATSLEARCPLLDYRVAEFAWRLPRAMRIDSKGGKRILRDVLARYVPPALTERPKQGFSVPIADWLKGPLNAWAEDHLAKAHLERQGLFDPSKVRRLWDQHRTGWRKNTKLIWAVLMFQMWADEYM
ncbi:MAG: asparagine synthase (glutamine-hydrolyzing) [Geminicoccaceae bacterium]